MFPSLLLEKRKYCQNLQLMAILQIFNKTKVYIIVYLFSAIKKGVLVLVDSVIYILLWLFVSSLGCNPESVYHFSMKELSIVYSTYN